MATTVILRRDVSYSYQVTAVSPEAYPVTFTLAPGALPPDAPDLIGKAADARAGFAVFRIGYSDGSQGVLCFSCMLPGSPDSILEGITASTGFVDFWNSVTAAQTIFHLLRRTTD